MAREPVKRPRNLQLKMVVKIKHVSTLLQMLIQQENWPPTLLAT